MRRAVLDNKEYYVVRIRNIMIGGAIGALIAGGGVASASVTNFPSHVKTWAGVNLRLNALHGSNVRQNAGSRRP